MTDDDRRTLDHFLAPYRQNPGVPELNVCGIPLSEMTIDDLIAVVLCKVMSDAMYQTESDRRTKFLSGLPAR